jgi:thymidylate kinase
VRQRVIILEGPDGCGKTNIGQGLSKKMGIPYFKMTTEAENWRKGKFKEALEFDQTYLAQLLKQTGYDLIIDRAYPSEWVYSQVFGRETNHHVLRRVDDIFAEIGAHIVIPWRQDYAKCRADELVPNEKLKTIHDKYFEFIKWTKCDTIPVNVDHYGDNLQLELDYIIPLVSGYADIVRGVR